jgi:hypothetical protein
MGSISLDGSSSSFRARLDRLPLWQIGAAAAAVAAVATEAIGAIAEAADVPMEVAGLGTDEAGEIAPGSYALSVAIATAVGVGLAELFRRRARRPARTFLVTSVVVTMLSFASPLTAADTTTATKLVLCLTHVVAAAIVIPALTLRLAGEEAPLASAGSGSAEENPLIATSPLAGDSPGSGHG